VFDIGGVLLDWDPRYVYRDYFGDEAEMDKFLTTICTRDWHRAHDLGADTEQSCRELALLHPEYAELIMAWSHRSEDMVAGQIEDTVEVLAELAGSGVRCLALSNMETDKFELRRARFSFFSVFSGCVISGHERVAKPDRKIFEILLSRYGLEPAATVFIDDQAANVDAAAELGVVALKFTTAAQLRGELVKLGLLAGLPAPPQLQQLIPDLAVHVGAQPAAHFVEQTAALRGRQGAWRAVVARGGVDVEPGDMLTKPDAAAAALAPGVTPRMRGRDHQHRAGDIQPGAQVAEFRARQDQRLGRAADRAGVAPKGRRQCRRPLSAQDDRVYPLGLAQMPASGVERSESGLVCLRTAAS